MAGHDIIVIGASAGGVEALSTVVSGLSADLPAAVFVVLHVAPNTPSVLPAILSRAGRLPAAHPTYGEEIRPGRIYVAPPDQHMLIRDGHVILTRGPKENAHRPAVDPLFRSAAVAHGRSVVGVVLSGALDDGTSGLRIIKELGGTAIVQNPNEATFSGMPLSAMENVAVDHVLYLREIPPMLMQRARTPVTGPPIHVPELIRMEDDIASMEEGAMNHNDRPGEPSQFTCPECNGTLFELRDGEIMRFRCRVGHAYSMESFVAEQAESVEAALWSALVALREKAELGRRMVGYMRERGHQLGAARFEEQVRDADQRARVLQDVLERAREQSRDAGDAAGALGNVTSPVAVPDANHDLDGGNGQ